MFINSSFGRTVDILHRSMDISLLRRDVIANNLANSDTPNFKKTSVSYEQFLKRALDSERVKAPEGRYTDEKHIPFYRPTDYRDVKPRRVLDYLTTAKSNGNNVDPEVETMDALNNQLLYQVMTQAVSHQFQMVNLVLR